MTRQYLPLASAGALALALVGFVVSAGLADDENIIVPKDIAEEVSKMADMSAKDSDTKSAAAAFFKVAPESVLVVHDESDLELGRLQLRLGGGLAGHNGLRSIAQHLKTQEFLRLRVGVGRPERGDPRPLADWVLADFAPHEDADALVARAADAVETLDAEGVERAQIQVNRR